ncbi:MAG: S1C family serine protease [Planctomycetaceae bacterium]
MSGPAIKGVAMAIALTSAITAVVARDASWPEVAATAARSVVKLYGAGGLRGLEAYQSGVILSPDGRIVTVMSTVLDSDGIDCVLDDGRRFPARLVGVDPRRELALLSIEASDLPVAVPAEGRAGVGGRVLAVSNLFGVAVGDERASVQRGVISSVVPLAARRGAAEAPYTGDVYVLDFTTNNPGSPGGAVVDARGRLLGVIGKELRSTATGLWLNYAMPIDEVERGCAAITAGTAMSADAPPAVPFDMRRLGVVFVPDLLGHTPAFIETVVPGTPAARAGLAADDLVIAVASRAAGSRAAVEAAVAAIAEGDPVPLSLIRAGAVVECDLGPRPPAGADR